MNEKKYKPKQKEKQKSKAREHLTNLQKALWDKLVGGLAPAPSPI